MPPLTLPDALSGLMFWAYSVASLGCLWYLGKLGFELVQTSRPCTPIALQLAASLVLVGVGLCVNPAFGLTPSPSGVVVAAAMWWLLHTVCKGRLSFRAAHPERDARAARRGSPPLAA